ncbi:salicylate hydroxylase [Heliocybe sulcata]|uniref:Salicylate hydroxylase n=1 Tax=Heliocybe sulcata TaxID=5364 RepID=A0A5C3N1A3_9AGAM|nr:salicylate hydroxylase [Heliocybe sulcata]
MNTSVRPPKFEVAVVGGGIAGLLCAFVLSKNTSIEVHVYEAAHQLSEVGAGIGIFSRVWKIIEELGLAESLLPLANNEAALTFHMRKSDSTEGLSFHDMNDLGINSVLRCVERAWINLPGTIMTFHRAELQQAILKWLPSSCKVHLLKRLTSVDEPDSMDLPVSLHFADGTTATCDLLIGADGIKSEVRMSMYRSRAAKARSQGKEEVADIWMRYLRPVWTGSVAYRGMVTKEQLMSLNRGSEPAVCKRPMMYCGSLRHVVGYPISNGNIVDIVAFTTDTDLEGAPFDAPLVSVVSNEEFVSKFQGFEQEVQDLLRFVDKPTRWAIHTVTPLPSFVSKRIALLGDAAHAMAPHQGAGASQAVEDTYILTSLLTHPLCTQETLPFALEIYDRIRRPLANAVLEGSRRAGFLFDFNLPGLREDDIMQKGADGTLRPSMEVLRQVGQTMDTIQEWIWKRAVQKDRECAITMLEECCSRGSLRVD